MNHTSIINPSVTFFRNYEESILQTRKSLFEELDGISTDFGNEARKILETKLRSNNNTPLLGELFPWIIKDLVNANIESTHKISVGWLAIYLYTLFLDEHVDNPKPLEPNKFLAGSLLAKTGLLQISRFTNNTPYENSIDKAFSFSAKNQQLDTKFQKEKTETDFKEKYSEGKNHIVLVCAGALAAENSKHAEFITTFTKNLLLTLQYLDDIADYQEDFASDNFTVLLNDAFKNNSELNLLLKPNTNRELLRELVVTGALQRVVEKIISLLNQSILLIKNEAKIDLGTSKSAVDFFLTLHTYCTSLNNLLRINQNSFRSFPPKKQSVILDKIENHITIIAQST